MATYLELFQLASDSDLQDKVAVALMAAAESILSQSPTAAADRVAWAGSVVEWPAGAARTTLRLVLAANRGLTVEGIRGASDAAIQANVDSLVDALVVAHASP